MSDAQDVILVPFAGRLVPVRLADLPTRDKVALDSAVENMRRAGDLVMAIATGSGWLAESIRLAGAALLPVAREVQNELTELVSRAWRPAGQGKDR